MSTYTRIRQQRGSANSFQRQPCLNARTVSLCSRPLQGPTTAHAPHERTNNESAHTSPHFLACPTPPIPTNDTLWPSLASHDTVRGAPQAVSLPRVQTNHLPTPRHPSLPPHPLVPIRPQNKRTRNGPLPIHTHRRSLARGGEEQRFSLSPCTSSVSAKAVRLAARAAAARVPAVGCDPALVALALGELAGALAVGPPAGRVAAEGARRRGGRRDEAGGSAGVAHAAARVDRPADLARAPGAVALALDADAGGLRQRSEAVEHDVATAEQRLRGWPGRRRRGSWRRRRRRRVGRRRRRLRRRRRIEGGGEAGRKRRRD